MCNQFTSLLKINSVANASFSTFDEGNQCRFLVNARTALVASGLAKCSIPQLPICRSVLGPRRLYHFHANLCAPLCHCHLLGIGALLCANASSGSERELEETGPRALRGRALGLLFSEPDCPSLRTVFILLLGHTPSKPVLAAISAQASLPLLQTHHNRFPGAELSTRGWKFAEMGLLSPNTQ